MILIEARAAALVAAALGMFAACQGASALDARQLIEREVINGVWPSPDGKQVMYGVDRASIQENRTTTTYWMKAAGDDRPAAQQALQGHALGWLSESQGLLYADADENVMSWNTNTGAVTEVTPVQKIKDVFPDAKSVSVAEIHVAPATQSVALIVQIVGRFDDHPFHGVEVDLNWYSPPDALTPGVLSPPTRNTIVVLDQRTGSIEKLLPDDYDVLGYGLGMGDAASVSWSPDGKRLAFTASLLKPPGQPNRDIYSDLYMVDTLTKSVTALVTTAGFEYAPRWSPDGRRIAIRTQAGRVDWRHDSTIGVVDISGSSVKYSIPTVGQPEDPRARYIGLGGWSRDSQTIYFSAPVRGYMRFMGLNVGTSQVVEPLPGRTRDLGFYTGPRWSRDTDLFVLQESSFDRESDLFSWRQGSGKLQRLTSLNKGLNAQPYCNVEDLTWPSDDGKWQLQGFLLTPITARKGDKLPLLVFVSGGPNMVSAVGSLRQSVGQYPWPIFLEKGYSIFIPNTRGREGFGAKFHHSLKDERGMNRVPAIDVISGVKYLISTGRVDSGRIGITAHSYGGGVAASVLTQTDLIRAASIHEAVAFSITSSDFHTAQKWKREQMEAYGIGSPFDASQRSLLVADSPGEHADKIRTPVLLEVGSQATAATQGRWFFHALQYFNVPSELIVYPRTGHLTTEPRLIEDSYRRNIEWFDYWLKGIATERMLKRYGPPKISRLN